MLGVQKTSLHAARPRQVEQAVDAAVLTRRDDLTRAVVVGRPHISGLFAECLDVFFACTEDRRHAAGDLIGHVACQRAALGHQAQSL